MKVQNAPFQVAILFLNAISRGALKWFSFMSSLLTLLTFTEVTALQVVKE